MSHVKQFSPLSDPPVPLPRLAALLAVTGLVTVGQLVLAQVEFSENSS